jgi:anti-anti-sigma factor
VGLNLLNLNEPALTSRASLDGSTLILSLEGTVDDKSRFKLEEVLARLHEESKRLAMRQVVLDLRALEFMNSSGMKVLVSWVRGAHKLTGTERYTIRFIVSPESHWQKRSLHAIVGLGDPLVTIETSSS